MFAGCDLTPGDLVRIKGGIGPLMLLMALSCQVRSDGQANEVVAEVRWHEKGAWRYRQHQAELPASVLERSEP